MYTVMVHNNTLGGEHALCHRAAHGGCDVGQLLALADAQPHGAVAAEVPHAGQHGVAHASQAGQGERVGAQCHSKARDLVQASGDERGAAVVAKAGAVAHTTGDGKDVFQRSAQLNTYAMRGEHTRQHKCWPHIPTTSREV